MNILLSYAHEDRESVQVLRADLESLDHTVWIDNRLHGGQQWWDAILEQIRDCDLFMVGLNPNQVESEPCEKELDTCGRSVAPSFR